MLKRYFQIILFSLLILSPQHFYAQDNVIDGIAAIVGDQIVLKSDVLQLVQMSIIERRLDPMIDQEKITNLQKNILNSLIDQKIVLEIAEVESIEVKEREVNTALEQHINSIVVRAGSESRLEELTGKTIKQLERELWTDIKNQLVMERFRETLIKDVTVTKNEVEQFYITYRDSIGEIPTLYNINHILFKIKPSNRSRKEAYKKIESLRERIIKGEDFKQHAGEYSQDPGSARHGGELGFVERGTFVPSFEEVAFSLKENELSKIVESPFGYHIIQFIKKIGDKINVRHILIIPEPSDEDIDSLYNFISTIRDSINENNNFEAFARKYSEDEFSRELGGSLGWINPQLFPIPEIPKILPVLKINEVSPPIRASDGYHLLRINSIKMGGTPTLKDHWSEIERLALSHKKNTSFNQWLINSRKSVFIKNLLED